MRKDGFLIEKEKSCLLVVDIQEKLFNVMNEDIRNMVAKNTGILIDLAKTLNIPIVLTEQYPRGLGLTIPAIKGKINDINPLEKTFFNCMKEESIAKKIKGLNKNTVIICGIESHICVLYTALSLLDQGYRVAVVSNAVCSRQKHDYKAGINALNNAGALIFSTETISFMLLEKSGTDDFRKISPLFK